MPFPNLIKFSLKLRRDLLKLRNNNVLFAIFILKNIDIFIKCYKLILRSIVSKMHFKEEKLINTLIRNAPSISYS